MNYFNTSVISNHNLIEDIYILIVRRNDISAKAGQFFMLKCWNNELTLMRPISIFKVEDTELHFMYRVIGEGTKRLAKAKRGQSISLLGALGNGFPIDHVSGSIALVGGGLGIPPLCETAKQLNNMDLQVDAFLGYRNDLFALDDFEPYCRDIFVSTEKGDEGYRGFITDLLKPEQYKAVFTCGPEVMMRKVAAMCKEKNIPCWCSMEHRMACGIGACLGCSIPTANGMKRVCKDGPVFLSTDIF